MPTRLLRDWTDSDRFDGLSAEAERLFLRLIMKVDDFGRFSGDGRRVWGACCAMVRGADEEAVETWLQELETHDLILRYAVRDRRYLVIPNFGQRIKDYTKPKFPTKLGEAERWLPVSEGFRDESECVPDRPGQAGTDRPYSYSKAKPYAEAESARGPRPGCEAQAIPAASVGSRPAKASATRNDVLGTPTPPLPGKSPSSPASPPDAGSARGGYRSRPSEDDPRLRQGLFASTANVLLMAVAKEIAAIKADALNSTKVLTKEAADLVRDLENRKPTGWQERITTLNARPDAWRNVLLPEAAECVRLWEEHRKRINLAVAGGQMQEARA